MTHEDVSPQKIEGMTLRDYFAAAALSGAWSDPDWDSDHTDTAKCCYAMADAMLAERERSHED